MFIALIQTAADSSKAVISENSKTFSTIDPMGIGMTAIGMAVVFSSLILLYILFLNISKVLSGKKKEKKEPKRAVSVKTVGTPADVNAAIALAIYLYSKQIHDNESMVLTMNKVARTYSPWSSKIYGLRQLPR